MRALAQARHLAFAAVAGLLVTTALCYGWAIARTGGLAVDLLRGDAPDDALLLDLLGVIDLYLLATVQLIVALGLHELFVGDLPLPAWLEARSLDDLKKSLVDMLVVFVAVKGVEKLVENKEPLDALAGVGAAAVLILSLTAFRAAKTAGVRRPYTATPSPTTPEEPVAA